MIGSAPGRAPLGKGAPHPEVLAHAQLGLGRLMAMAAVEIPWDLPWNSCGLLMDTMDIHRDMIDMMDYGGQ